MFRLKNAKKPSYADMKMKDFEEGMYLMDDGTYVDFSRVDDGYGDILTDPSDDPDKFLAEAFDLAAYMNVKPGDISDRNGWKNLRMIFYEIYNEFGEDAEDGAEYLYCEKETVGNWCGRNLDGKMPVQRIPDEIADEWRY